MTPMSAGLGLLLGANAVNPGPPYPLGWEMLGWAAGHFIVTAADWITRFGYRDRPA